MSYEKKIQTELDKEEYFDSFEDRVYLDVAKFGKQADAEVAKLKRAINALENCLICSAITPNHLEIIENSLDIIGKLRETYK